MAKRTAKTKAPAKRDPVFVGWLPVASTSLTPKAAAAWLEDEAPQWGELIQLSLHRASREERKFLAELALHVGEMTRAAALAIGSGRPVELSSMLDPREDDSAGRVAPLAVVLRAACRVDSDDDGVDDALRSMQAPLLAIAEAMLRCARHASAEHGKRWKAEREARHRERLATDPAYRAQMEAHEHYRKGADEAARMARAAEAAA